MQRYNFLDVFQENPDGSLTPKRTISVNGVLFGPGASFQKGVSIGGIDFHQFRHLAIAGIEQNDVLEIQGFFNQ